MSTGRTSKTFSRMAGNRFQLTSEGRSRFHVARLTDSGRADIGVGIIRRAWWPGLSSKLIVRMDSEPGSRGRKQRFGAGWARYLTFAASSRRISMLARLSSSKASSSFIGSNSSWASGFRIPRTAPMKMKRKPV